MAVVSLEWGDQYKSGVDFIDDSHERIFSLINALAVPGKKPTDAQFKAALAVFLDYTGKHFREEEELMQFTEYPFYEAHKADHEKAIAWILELQKEAELGRVNPEAIAQFAGEWMTSHLHDYDFHFIKWIRKTKTSTALKRVLATKG